MHPSYFPVFLWSIVIFISFLGYGETLCRSLRRPEFADLGWGLTAAWGMAVTLAIGGLLMAFKLAVAPILTAVVGLGAVLAIIHGMSRLLSGGFSFSALRMPLSDVVLYLLAALAFASSIAWPHHIDPNDDLICYLMLPVKLLATGTLIEPFSFQRAGTFGGQSILQALVMIVGAERNGHVPDMGFGHAIFFGILSKILRKQFSKHDTFTFILLLLVLIIPVPRISTASSLTGSALLIALYETFRRASLSCEKPSLVALVPVALLMAGASTLRPMWMLAAFCFVGIHFLSEIWMNRKTPEKSFRAAIAAGGCAIIALALLIPWAWVLHTSNGTFLNPPFGGNVNPSFVNMSTREGLFADLVHAFGFLTTPEVAVFMIALMAVFAIPANPLARIVSLSVVISVFLIAVKCAVVIASEVYRYTFPILLPAVSFILLYGKAGTSSGMRPTSQWACLALIMLVNFAPGMNLLRERIVSLTSQTSQRESFFSADLNKSYAQLQELVPQGGKILAVVDAPYLLDFKRNKIDTVNSIGSAGPHPGLPFKQGPEGLRKYLLEHGYRYVICVDFDKAVLLYTRKLWMDHKRPEWYWKQVWAPHALDFMDSMDELARDGGTVATAANARLIDLDPKP